MSCTLYCYVNTKKLLNKRTFEFICRENIRQSIRKVKHRERIRQSIRKVKYRERIRQSIRKVKYRAS